MSTLLAGAAKVDVTPTLGTIINGEFVAYYAHTIHDPLFSKALVLKAADITIAVVMVDICAMDKDFIIEVKEGIAADTGIPAKHILIAATHTHYAGSIVDLLGSPCDLPYRQKLGALIAYSVKEALAQLQPAKIGYTSLAVPEHVVCRRYFMKEGYKAVNPVTGGLDRIKTNPVGGEAFIDRRASVVDTELSALAVQSVKGEWISVLANYSMHYVGDCTNGTVTADYFGVFARHLASYLKAGGDFVAMLSNGTSGEANIWDFLQPDRYPQEEHQKKEVIGKDLALKLSMSLERVEWTTEAELSGSLKFIPLGVRKPSAEEVEAAKKIVAATDYRLINPDAEAMKRVYAREQVLLNEYPDHIEFPVHAIRIGDITIGGLGGEFFAETGLNLKKAAAGKYFTITMANGYIGYVPPAHEIENGGYETWRCRTSFIKEDGEEIVKRKLTEMIQK